jgi:hypothetical protein
MTEEIFLKVSELDRYYKQFEGYEVSNYGNVRKDGVILELKPNKKGYVCMYGKIHLHTIVASAFLDVPKGKFTIKPIDGNQRNNHVNNLKIVP